jgi:hypothetical protein
MRIEIQQANQINAALANYAIRAAIEQQQANVDDQIKDPRKGQNLDVLT